MIAPFWQNGTVYVLILFRIIKQNMPSPACFVISVIMFVRTARKLFFFGKRDQAPMMTCTSAVSPEGRTGRRLPWQISPFKRISFMPCSTAEGLLTVILYTAPLYLRDTLYPLQFAGMQGSIRSPSNVGLIPRIAWLILRKVQAAVPVSQLFFASPKLGASLPAII